MVAAITTVVRFAREGKFLPQKSGWQIVRSVVILTGVGARIRRSSAFHRSLSHARALLSRLRRFRLPGYEARIRESRGNDGCDRGRGPIGLEPASRCVEARARVAGQDALRQPETRAARRHLL